MSYFNGMQIVLNSLAREVRDEFKVERNPIQKRRRGWRVVKHHIDQPCCYQMGGTLVMHPDVYAAITKATPTPTLPLMAAIGDAE